ncbi:rolling circle replication-associated protein [Microbacterium sp. Root61]|uniref:rolling circle replication-associated protein n=1 Tax=Microbacterium sp. Root61 TaxID=1736570 RepID=UPI0012E3BA9D|nr:hypothetical protein [Microbacterium sp. Root61]
MRAVGAAIPQVEDREQWRSKYAHTAAATFLDIGPGVVRIRQTRPGQEDHERDLTWEARRRNVDAAVAQLHGIYHDSMALLNDVDMEVLTAPDPVRRAVRGRPSKATRGKIVGWSNKSRNRMRIRLNQLDWAPLFESGNEPALVTLTLPGDWLTVAPTPAAYKALIDRFKIYYDRAWGERPRGVWKQEFQRRGAPHTHILMTPPAGVAKGHLELEFPQWLSRTWANIVNHPDPDEYARHVKAGTGVDYVGDGYRDPRRIASYFAKHGTFNDKEYQNDMPTAWRDQIANGEAGTQFWGVWRLEKAVAVLQLNDAGSTTIESLIDPFGVSRIFDARVCALSAIALGGFIGPSSGIHWWEKARDSAPGSRSH